MNRIARILRSSFIPLLAFRLTALGLVGCVHVSDHDMGAQVARDRASTASVDR